MSSPFARPRCQRPTAFSPRRMAALMARNGTLRRGPSGVMRIRRLSMPRRVSSHADGWPLTPAERDPWATRMSARRLSPRKVSRGSVHPGLDAGPTPGSRRCSPAKPGRIRSTQGDVFTVKQSCPDVTIVTTSGSASELSRPAAAARRPEIRSDRPTLQAIGAVPEHPLQPGGAHERPEHLVADGRARRLRHPIGDRDHLAHARGERLVGVGVDPGLIGVVGAAVPSRCLPTSQ